MCGRYSSQNPDVKKIGSILGMRLQGTMKPRFNIAPGQFAPIINQDDDSGVTLHHFKWGLVPNWSKDTGQERRVINVRSENMCDIGLFRSVILRRCLVVADGFYEWMEVSRARQPLRFFLTDRTMPMIFAGICATWPTASGSKQPLQTYAVLTTKANDLIVQISERMPAILPEHHWHAWLDSRTTAQELQSMLVPFDAAAMDCYRVCPLVNDPDFEDPAAVEKYQPLPIMEELMVESR